MSWTDLNAIKTMHAIKNHFQIATFIETGTHKGVNAYFHAPHFDHIFTVEISPSSITDAYTKRLHKCPNVFAILGSSPQFLKHWIPLFPKDKMLMLYLDAHFYDPSLPKEKRFVVLDELKALAHTHNCFIIIHDFDNQQLGHITYDGISLDADLLRNALYQVNPNFHFYSNTKEQCDIIHPTDVKKAIYERLQPDEDILDNLNYAWSSAEKTYRGILYCSPAPLVNSIDVTPFDIATGKLINRTKAEL